MLYDFEEYLYYDCNCHGHDVIMIVLIFAMVQIADCYYDDCSIIDFLYYYCWVLVLWVFSMVRIGIRIRIRISIGISISISSISSISIKIRINISTSIRTSTNIISLIRFPNFDNKPYALNPEP